MKPYYRVNNPNRALPSSTSHGTQAEAIAKANENAAKHPGEAFEILECIAIVSTTVPEPSVFFMDGKTPEESPAPKPLKLEIGKQYVRRDGKKSGIISASHKNPNYPFFDPWFGLTYTNHGTFFQGETRDADLVSEYEG